MLTCTPRVISSLLSVQVACVSAAGYHVACAGQDGSCWSWGYNAEGQLGHGDLQSRHKPSRLLSLASTKVMQIASGGEHILFLCEDRSCWGSGQGADGQLGQVCERQCTPEQIPELVAMEVACGWKHCLARTESGGVVCWGAGDLGQLGLQQNTMIAHSPQAIPGLADVVHVACGDHSSFAVLCDGSLFGWGWNAYHQLGHEKLNRVVHSPTMVLPSGAKQVASGEKHTLVLLKDGSVLSTGLGQDGELGHGDTRTRTSLTPVSTLVPVAVTGVAAGGSHSCCVFRQGATDMVAPLPPPEDEILGGGEGSKAGSWFVSGDLNGLVALFTNTIIGFVLYLTITDSFGADTDRDFVSKKLIPATSVCVLVGNLWCSWLCHKLTQHTNQQDHMAMPFGINVVLTLPFTYSVMAVEWNATKDLDKALDVGVFACFMTGVLEILFSFMIEPLRRLIPKAALLSCLAGVSLSYISMGFAFEIFAHPVSALPSLFLILCAYGSGVLLPLNCPGALGAILLGVVIAWGSHALSSELGVSTLSDIYKPNQTVGYSLDYPYLPIPTARLFRVLANGAGWQYASVILPLALQNTVNDFVNCDAAEQSGDPYHTRTAVILVGATNILSSLFGNPYPGSLYVGHAAYKGMGARTHYSTANGVLTLLAAILNAGVLFPVSYTHLTLPTKRIV
eukprot:TRINITY_DN27444_c0_g1_i2.p1 TRINITY_DN27444_c0_g1~~TRINITY_DN27444_c0_g1_i2.p1  ORF type:complete len:678 (+),score=123.64 TRINITY_DN27444_c0_g1_i2:251-2284(+)